MISLSSFISYFFPTYCEVCGERIIGHGTYICTKCLDSLPSYHDMEVIYHAWDRLAGHVPFTEYQSDFIFTHGNVTRRLIHHIKYHNAPQLGYRMARHSADYHIRAGHFSDITMIIPIPLTKRRMRKRGYNQAEYIARGLGDAMTKDIYTGVLVRQAGSGTQTDRTKQARWKAMENAFCITDPLLLKGKRILIVDDVLTSGATLVHGARAILSAGAESVSFYTLALDTYV